MTWKEPPLSKLLKCKCFSWWLLKPFIIGLHFDCAFLLCKAQTYVSKWEFILLCHQQISAEELTQPSEFSGASLSGEQHLIVWVVNLKLLWMQIYSHCYCINQCAVRCHCISYCGCLSVRNQLFPVLFFQSGGLDGNNSCYNPASLGSIPLHSLPHILQEQMNGALGNGSGYQSDSSATQSPPQAL